MDAAQGGTTYKAAGWRQLLRAEPASRLRCWPPQTGVAASAAEVEFGRANFADGRLRTRLVRIAERWLQRAGPPIPEMFAARADQRAVYRFLHNGKVSFEGL